MALPAEVLATLTEDEAAERERCADLVHLLQDSARSAQQVAEIHRCIVYGDTPPANLGPA